MTYQVLARKWRPGNFDDMVGQGHVLKPLTHALDNQRLHHAYLFTGTRGVGKTTLARILAKCLNCEQGISSKPCGKCSACKEIAEGRFIDLIEVDAASRTKVEDTRELLENVQYVPGRGRYKIYLIDEVHMLSNHSFNALLKTLEEPPPHIMFLFATTDPQKLPVTILSRCLQFNLKNLNPQQIESYLKKLLDEEKIAFEESALWQLAAAAAGSMRDALTLLDQAISFCQGEVLSEGVTEMLGTPEQGVIYKLLDSLENRDSRSLLQAVQEAAEHAPDFVQLLDSLLNTLHRIAIAQVIPEAIDNSFGDQDQIQHYASSLAAEDLQLFYQFGLKGKADLALASDQRGMFEMLMIRMLVFSPDGVPAVPKVDESKAEKAEQPNKKKKADQTGNSETRTTPRKTKKKSSTSPKVKSESKSARLPEQASSNSKVIPVETVAPAVEKSEKPVEKPPISKPDELSENRYQLHQVDDSNWHELVAQLSTSGITGNLLANCVFRSITDDQLKLVLDCSQSAIFSEEHRRRIEEALRNYFQSELSVDIQIDELQSESPAARSQRLRQQQIEKIQNEFAENDNVNKLLDRFSGKVLKDTISPAR